MRSGPAVLAAAFMLAGCSHSAPAPSNQIVLALPNDQTRVSGNVTSATVTGVLSTSLPMPVTITIPVRGSGELNIGSVVVNGKPGTVSWDGGQPLPLTGTGSIGLGQVKVTIDGSGATWHLDGAERTLSPGQYTAHSSVAIGNRGLGTPEDYATFSVPAGANGEMVTVGDAQIHTSPHAWALTGPGALTLDGTLQLHTNAGDRTVHHLALPSGSFTLTFNGTTVTGLVEGSVTSH